MLRWFVKIHRSDKADTVCPVLIEPVKLVVTEVAKRYQMRT